MVMNTLGSDASNRPWMPCTHGSRSAWPSVRSICRHTSANWSCSFFQKLELNDLHATIDSTSKIFWLAVLMAAIAELHK